MEIEKLVNNCKIDKNGRNIFQPVIFDLSDNKDKNFFIKLIKEGTVNEIVDEYSEIENELQLIKDPSLLFKNNKLKEESVATKFYDGKWIYYPWKNCIVHIIDEDDFYDLRISRNNKLITKAEQKKFKDFKIGIAGLNVGNPAAVCIALEGGSKCMKFADFDILSASNLNRFRSSLSELGLNKAILTARQVFEIDPYMKIDIFDQGVISGDEEKFLLDPKLDLLIEETDNLKLKIDIREKAKKYKIPVLMVTGNGENLIIDIERYDIDEDLKIMNGYLQNNIIAKINNKPRDIKEKIELAKDFIGAKYLVTRLQESFSLIGNKIAGIPQLAECSFLRGAVLCYFARQIANNYEVPSGRYEFRMDKIINKKC